MKVAVTPSRDIGKLGDAQQHCPNACAFADLKLLLMADL
jgi:hypothetical protein